jgi:predicted ferric reductase
MSLFAPQEEASTAGTRTGGGATSSIADAIATATGKAVAAATSAASGGQGGKSGSGTEAVGPSTTSAAPKKNNALKALKKKQIQNAVYYTWYITAGVVFACFVVYAWSVARAWYIRRKVAAARRAGATPSTNGAASASGFFAALNAMYQNTAYVLVVPTWIYTVTTTAEWWWTFAYIGIVLGVGFWGCIVNGNLDYANPMGYVAFGQIPLIIALASRNNIISWITGVSYEKLNYLHRAAGRVCVLTTWLHTLGWFHKGLGRHGPGTVIFLSGMLGSVAALILWLTSFALARRIAYEFFLVTHILMSVLFIVGSYYHWPRLGEWCWVGLVIWGFDRVVAAARMFIVNKAWLMPLSSRRSEHSGCVVELVEQDVVRLTVNRPLFRWSPGQHAFITMPGVATLRYEQHPMTIANVPDESGDVVFLIRAQSGFTRRLVNRLQSSKATDINCYLEGPYGVPHGLNHYDSVILLSGGTGVTYTLAHFLSIIKSSREQTTAVSQARMVWNVRDAAHVAWIAPMINTAVDKGTGQTRFIIDVYVTRSGMSDETDRITHPAEPVSPDAPGTPESYSPSGSSENVTEKGSFHGSSRDDKLAIAAGLTPAAAAMFSWHRGRSHIEGILSTDVQASSTDAAGVALTVCGPTELQLDARRAVFRVNSSSKILKGQNPVTFYSETFGW